MTLFGGLALFLYGINKMSDGMKLTFESKNFKKIKKIMKGERKYRELERVLRETHLKRVQKKRADSIATHSIHGMT